MTIAVVILACAAAALGALSLLLWRRDRLLRTTVGNAVVRMTGVTPEPAAVASHLTRAVGALEEQIDDLQVEHARYLSAINGSEFGILIADADGRAVLVNPQAARYVSAGRGEVVVEHRFRSLVDDVMRTGHSEEREFEIFAPEPRLVQLSAVPMSEAGRSFGAILYIQDLTERRRVDQMRQDFVANVSHELKTPLGALSILSETIGDSDDPHVRRRLTDRLITETKRMARIVDDILKLSHLASADTKLRPLVVADVVKQAYRRVSVTAEERGIDLEGSQPVPELLVAGDHEQLVSAVSNLLDNAIKYTSVAEREHATVRWRTFPEDGWVVIEVEDEGVGIPQGQLSRIFERFYRVDSARSRETGGTGLGLAIVRNVARNHGGDVSVESELGKGSTFRLRIPQLMAPDGP